MSETEKKRTVIEPDDSVILPPEEEAKPAADEAGAARQVKDEEAAKSRKAPARMPSSAVATGPQPSLDDVKAWDGYRVDGIEGDSVARIDGLFVDRESGDPVWVLAKLGRFGRVVPISVRECAAAAGRVWVPHDREVIRNAPAVDPTQPLTGEQEQQILDYYGIPEGVGRGAELRGRDEDRVTAKPPKS